MANKPAKNQRSSNVTIARNGARSVNLGQLLNSSRGQEQLRQVGKLQSNVTTPTKGSKK